MDKKVAAFWAFVGVWFLASGLIGREELGILGAWGLQPITVVAEHSWVVAVLVGMMFADLLAWWGVHLYRRKYGDLRSD